MSKLRIAEGLRYEKRANIAIITLDRQAQGNSLTPEMHVSMRAIWADVKHDPDVRAAIITGSGERHFCTGIDVAGVAATGRVTANSGSLAESVHWSPRQNDVLKPTICAVNGLVAGGGLHFVVDCDIVLAAEGAAFMDTHVNVGMVGALEPIGLARRMPLGSALRMTLMGRHYRMPAERAYQLGLVDELVPLANLMATAEEMAQLMVDNSPTAMALSKQAVWHSLEVGYTEALKYGWKLIQRQWAHPDFKEGPRAFVEKRHPRWQQPENSF